MSTKDFLPHDQENYLTWGLDFDYDPHANSGSYNSMVEEDSI